MISDGNGAVATIITAETERGTFVVFGVEDPRWHLKSDGTYEGIKAIENGAARALPLKPGFVGGGINRRETSAQAALRELREEAGNGIAEQASKSGLHLIFVSLRSKPSDPPTTYYYHAHIKMDYDALKACVSQGKTHTTRDGDDSLALMLVKPEQIMRSADGYVLKGPPVEPTAFRDFVQIPQQFGGSQAQQAALTHYNGRGEKEPLIGIDTASANREMKVYTPPGGDPSAALTDAQVREEHGYLHPSNGAILEFALNRMREKPAETQRASALRA